jgi:putative transposase
VFVKINEVKHYLWRAVDHEGEVLENFVAKSVTRRQNWNFCENRRNGMAIRK